MNIEIKTIVIPIGLVVRPTTLDRETINVIPKRNKSGENAPKKIIEGA